MQQQRLFMNAKNVFEHVVTSLTRDKARAVPRAQNVQSATRRPDSTNLADLGSRAGGKDLPQSAVGGERGGRSFPGARWHAACLLCPILRKPPKYRRAALLLIACLSRAHAAAPAAVLQDVGDLNALATAEPARHLPPLPGHTP